MEKRKFNWSLFWKLLTSLVLFWVLLVGELNIYNLLMGTVVSIVIMLVFALSYEKENDDKIKLKTFGMIKFGLLVIFNIYKASLIYMKKIFINNGRPEVVNIDIGIENNMIAILIANAITLTPGTITIDVKEKENSHEHLFTVHAIDAQSAESVPEPILSKVVSFFKAS